MLGIEFIKLQSMIL